MGLSAEKTETLGQAWDKLLVDFMAAVEMACQQEGVEPRFVEKVAELDDEFEEGEDDEDKPNR